MSFHRLGGWLAAIPLLLPLSGVDRANSAPLEGPAAHPKFEEALPNPAVIDATDGGSFVMEISEFSQWLGLRDTDGGPLDTTVWGYGQAGGAASYPGPTFVAREGVAIDVLWENELPNADVAFPDSHLLPVDPRLHIAHAVLGIPTVTHLHGGHTESASDGLPEAWYTQGFTQTGAQFVKEVHHYDNDQEAATLWYHDHALGVTRLNVYAGLAGFYLLRDQNELRMIRRGVLPGGDYERGIVIQDRSFTSDGQLTLPTGPPELADYCAVADAPCPSTISNIFFKGLDLSVPSAVAEFFGDYILVNSMAWPVLSVEPRKYRLRLLNGSDSRFYLLEFRDDAQGGEAQAFLQIGTDTGLLPVPVPLERLLLAPGERADVIVDFGAVAASEIFLRNFGPDEPFKGFNEDGTLSDGEGGELEEADAETTGLIMKFAVDQELSDVPEADVGERTRLRRRIEPLRQNGPARPVVLFEGLDEFGRLQPLLGTLEEGSKTWDEPITENVALNDVEVWEIYNATPDAHPIHLHLVAFQILDRQPFTFFLEDKAQIQHDGSYGVGGRLTNVELVGQPEPPADNEAGWKDTVVAPPGQVTRVVARFDRPGRYVWHCHILSHEDHEMMRPYLVGPPGRRRCGLGWELALLLLPLASLRRLR